MQCAYDTNESIGLISYDVFFFKSNFEMSSAMQAYWNQLLCKNLRTKQHWIDNKALQIYIHVQSHTHIQTQIQIQIQSSNFREKSIFRNLVFFMNFNCTSIFPLEKIHSNDEVFFSAQTFIILYIFLHRCKISSYFFVCMSV